MGGARPIQEVLFAASIVLSLESLNNVRTYVRSVCEGAHRDRLAIAESHATGPPMSTPSRLIPNSNMGLNISPS